MIPDEKMARLWGYLERSFNLTIYKIDSDIDDSLTDLALVTMDAQATARLPLLPDEFEGSRVRYNPVNKPKIN